MLDCILAMTWGIKVCGSLSYQSGLLQLTQQLHPLRSLTILQRTMAETSSSQTTLKPSAARTSSSSPHKSASSSVSIPRPPLSTHPSATVSEQAYFQGTHPVSIGAGTVIHPRAKLLSFEGPISIGEGCIIGEKAVIGGGPSSKGSGQASAEAAATGSEGTASTATILENAVQVGPLATVSEAAHIGSAATVDTSASLGKYARIGKHSKVCPSCHVPDNAIVEDWIVVWGGGGSRSDGGTGLQKRRRRHDSGSEATVELGAGDVEDARLTVLSREREGLTKLIGAGAAARRR